MSTTDAILKKDHKAVKALFKKWQSGDDSVRSEIVASLRRHDQAEMTVFYPALHAKVNDELDDILRHAAEEHASIRQLVDRAEINVTVMPALIDEVTRHIKEEEASLLPKAKEHAADVLTDTAEEVQEILAG